MYDRLLALWVDGRLTEAQLDVAVVKGWITSEEREAIAATPRGV